MDLNELNATARALVAPGKGILAADESSGTIKKRFDAIGVESTETNRRDYREMLFSTKGAGDFISGVILFDETIRQSAADGTPLVKLLEDQGIIPGIKVDAGAMPLAFAEGETVTEGLDGLRGRLAEYRELGARFAKWRGDVQRRRRPPERLLRRRERARARALRGALPGGRHRADRGARGADGGRPHDRRVVPRDRARRRPQLFHELLHQNVEFEGILLKPNMVLPGYDCPKQVSDEEIAEATVRCFRITVPAAVPGIVFLSGGQSDEQATARLERDQPARAAPVAGELLVRPRAPGGGAEGVEGRCRQRRQRLKPRSSTARG